MTQALLKAKLIAAIEATDEQLVLEALDQLLSNYLKRGSASVNAEQYNKEIDSALAAIACGEVTTHETVRKRFIKK